MCYVRAWMYVDAGLGASGAMADRKVNARGQGELKTGQEKLRVESAALSS